MLEVEIKSRCSDHSDVEKRIVSMGGVLEKNRSESDEYFNHPARDFAQTDEAFRIRTADGSSCITYKGPKLGTTSKTRFEEEVSVGNRESMRIILEKLGFRSVLTIRKERKLYLLKGIEVCLDTVEGLGTFVELELQGEDKELLEGKLFALAGELGLSEFETRSYLELKLGVSTGAR
ncbi:MAG TPA: class IV adenylate cyclase [Spirochaetota bacterium]|nr:class IV adenylate cyclase [Spirochaetota bacterium]